MLSVNEALALIRDELGHPNVVFPDAHDPTALRRAARDAGDGSLLVLFARTPGQAAHLRVLLQRLVPDVRVMDVAEGYLVLGHQPGRRRGAVRAPTARPAAWSSPDATPAPGAHPDDLDDRAVHRWLRRAMPSERRAVPDVGSVEDRYLGSLGIYALDGRIWRPSVAAMVLAGRRPELFLPGCTVVGMLDGEPIELRGVISDLLAGLTRELDAEIARPVIEVVRNALLHRDWGSDAPVEIRLEGDRLEVVNPGCLGRRDPNPLLVHLARELGVARGKGTGLPAVAHWLECKGLPRYSLVDREGVVRFVADLPRDRSRRSGATEPSARRDGGLAVTDEPVLGSVGTATATPLTMCAPWFATAPWSPLVVAPAVPEPSPPSEPSVTPPPSQEPVAPPAPAIPSLLPRDPDRRADAILSVLRARGRATTRESADALGCSRPVIGKVLTTLVADGRVAKVSASPRSPFQAYKLPTP